MNDAEEIKKRMMEQIQKEMEKEQQRQVEKEIIEAQKKALLKQLLDSEARARLERIRLAKPQEVEYIENQIIALYQMGKIRTRITDEILKLLIKNLLPEKRDIKIRRI
ncbi:MAG TPA: hypothetical protein ENI52_02305 [Thermoplasmata archaeon]|nr:hypothetical protein [Thermoplasmata archaeon]